MLSLKPTYLLIAALALTVQAPNPFDIEPWWTPDLSFEPWWATDAADAERYAAWDQFLHTGESGLVASPESLPASAFPAVRARVANAPAAPSPGGYRGWFPPLSQLLARVRPAAPEAPQAAPAAQVAAPAAPQLTTVQIMPLTGGDFEVQVGAGATIGHVKEQITLAAGHAMAAQILLDGHADADEPLADDDGLPAPQEGAGHALFLMLQEVTPPTPLSLAFDPTDKGRHVTFSTTPPRYHATAATSKLSTGSVRISDWVDRSGHARARARVDRGLVRVGLVVENRMVAAAAGGWDDFFGDVSGPAGYAWAYNNPRRLLPGGLLGFRPAGTWVDGIWESGDLFRNGCWVNDRQLPSARAGDVVEVELRDGALHYIVAGVDQGAVFQIPQYGRGRVALVLYLGRGAQATLVPDA